MRIYRRGKIYWLQWRNQRVSLKVTDRAAAEAAAREHQRRFADPRYEAAHSTSLSAICTAFYQMLSAGEGRVRPLADGTLEMYRTHLGHFKRLIGSETAMVRIGAREIEAYIATRRREAVPGKRAVRKVSAHTVAKELGTWRVLLLFALRKGWYHEPIDRVIPRRLATGYVPLDRALTEDQVPKLLAELPEGRAAACAFIVGLGADWVAVPRARLEDFDMAKGLVLVRGSKNARRFAWVPVLEPFRAYVEQAYAYLETHQGFLPWRNRWRELTSACERAGVPRVTVRDLRRTFGKALRARGVPPHILGGLLRHADGRMAETTYGRLSPEDLGKLAVSALQTSTLSVHTPPVVDDCPENPA